MAAPAQLSAWQARFSRLESTLGRHASPLVPLQPGAGCTGGNGSSGGGGSSSPWLAPRRAVRYDGRGQPDVSSRAYGAPLGSLIIRPSAAMLQQQQDAQQGAASVAGAGPARSPSAMELARRQKISQANKGRVPWNKGRKHPPETIARIKAATRQAMQRPEVKERLAKGNEKREPHTDEAKAKIWVKLLQRAWAAREMINEQSARIVERMCSSDDPVWRECGQYERAREVVAGLAWQYFKKDWEQVGSRGWDEHPNFRDRIIFKISKLLEKKKKAEVPKKAKKVTAALAHMRKVEEARDKLSAAEGVMAKLQHAKSAFTGDPTRLRQALEAEEQACGMIARLRQQLARMEEVLQPLQHHIEAGQQLDAAMQHKLELEQWLESEHERTQQEEGGVDFAAASYGAVAPDSEEGEAEEEPMNGEQQQQEGSPAAKPPRHTMPWQQ